MKHEILFKPSFATIRFNLEPGEQIVAESGAMVGMTPGIDIKTSVGGTRLGFFGKILNFLIALIRKFLGGESLFLNTFTAPSAGGDLWLAPAMVGDLTSLTVTPGKPVIIQPGSFVACTTGVALKTRWGGLRSIFGGEGAFLVEAGGEGQVWINSYGGIEEIEVDGTFTCDTGHMVAFDASLDYRLRLAGGGLMTSFKSGEGLVFEFSGRGKLLIQSRNLDALVAWVTNMLPR